MADSNNDDGSTTGTVVPSPSQNPESPYYLYPGESPGFVLVSPPLSSEKNYYHWSRAIRTALSSKNKFEFVTGELPMPAATDPFLASWKRCNNIVISWITRTLSPQISQSVIGIDSARDLWLDLEDRFSKGNHFRMSDILQELHSMRQGDRSLSQFFTEIKILWDELEYMRPTPTCSCTVTCTCSLSTFIKKFKDTKFVICFLKGLNDSYSAVRTQILIMDPLPSINKCFALALQQERPGPVTTTDSTVFAASSNFRNSQGRGTNNNSQGRGRGREGPRPPMLCTHCDRTNHTIENYWIKHGYPPGYRPRNSFTSFQVSSDTTSSSTQANPPHIASASNSDQAPALSREDYQYLVSLLHASKSDDASSSHTPHKSHNSDSTPHIVSSVTKPSISCYPISVWIMDSGASDHVCPYIACFSSLSRIDPITVTLPN